MSKFMPNALKMLRSIVQNIAHYVNHSMTIKVPTSNAYAIDKNKIIRKIDKFVVTIEIEEGKPRFRFSCQCEDGTTLSLSEVELVGPEEKMDDLRDDDSNSEQ